MTKPAAHLITWPTGRQTAVAGAAVPPYTNRPGTSIEPLFKDASLFSAIAPDYEAAAGALAQLLDGEAEFMRDCARAAVNAALGITPQ